jgi:hypothetical protein
MIARLAAAFLKHRHLRGQRVLCWEDGTPAEDQVLQGNDMLPGWEIFRSVVRGYPRFELPSSLALPICLKANEVPD